MKTKQTYDNAIIIDGKNMILGRLATKVATMLLHGKQVVIVNAKESLIVGSPKLIIEKYHLKRRNKVTKKGPYIHRSPSSIVKRVIRGMLPFQKPRGKQAEKRLVCYDSTPSFLINKDKQVIEDAKMKEQTTLRYVAVGTISEHLGYKTN